jgi:hypothetical protein
MRKLLITLFSIVALSVSAQIPQQEDTLRIITSNGQQHEYLFGNVKSLEFSGNSKLFINFYDNTFAGFPWSDVKSLSFHNRYSNPDVLLKAQESGAYEGLYAATYNPFALLYMVSCIASDEMLGGGGLQDNMFHGPDLLSSVAYPKDEVWNVYYKTIGYVNNAIAQLDFMPAEVKKSDIDHARGEALFLRAYYYSQLASIFGPVPVVINYTWEEKMTTVTAEATWGQILLDLKNAISLMDGYSPTLTVDDSRVGKYAAEALLARSFLFYTGFYQGVHDIAANDASVTLPDGSTLTKTDVIAYINDCVMNSGFSLVKDFRNLWPYTNRLTVEDYSYTQGQGLKWVEDDGAVNPEVLFKIKYNKNASWNSNTTIGYANRVALYMGIRLNQDFGSTFPFGYGRGVGPVSSAFYSDWAEAEPNDMRRNASIQDVSEWPNYRMGSQKDAVQETQYHEKKNSPVTCKRSEYSYSSNFEPVMYDFYGDYQMGNIHPLNIIRFADVLLMQSELTGTVDGINKVRERAGLPALSDYSLAALQNERRWELAFEGVRWNDMRRWGDDYCKAALDKQMDIEVYNQGVKTPNPQGIMEYDNNPTSYSQRYAVNHGFFAMPTILAMEGGAAIDAMQGSWTYQNDELLLDYIEITNDRVVRYDGDNQQVAEGTLSITKTDDFANLICKVTFTDGSMLPVSENSEDNDGTLQYDLTCLDESTMTLTSSKGTLTLRRTTSEERMLRDVLSEKWSFAISTGYDYSVGANVTVGSYGLTSRNSELTTVGSIPVAYMPHIESVTVHNLQSYLSSKGIEVINGETDPFAYMTLSMKDKKIRKYTSDGSLISEKAFTAKLDGGLIYITTEPDAILVPYLYNDTNQKEVSFMVRSNPTQANFTNTYGSEPGLVLVSTSEVDRAQTYWMFGRRGLTDEELESKLTITQQDEGENPRSTGRFLKVTLDVPYDYHRLLTCEYEDGTKVPETSEGVYVIKGTNGETLTKTLRFRYKNSNQTEAVTERTFTVTIDNLQRVYIYGENPDWEPPFTASAENAAALRFSDTEGMYLPTLSDEIYFGHKTLIIDVSEASDDCVGRVMNGWWSAVYEDNIQLTTGMKWEVQITDEIANDCARSAGGKDLNLYITKGSCTIKSVYYEE